MLAQIAPGGRPVTRSEVDAVVRAACPPEAYRGQRVLLIVPDATRTGPVGMVFRAVHEALGETTKALDVMIALGTHPRMAEAAVLEHLSISPAEKAARYGRVRLLNHCWNDPSQLRRVGTIGADEIERLSGGRFRMEVPVDINRAIFAYDRLIIIGPVFPHEVVGFSGGNKYLFPGIAGAAILNFFHWLGAVITNAQVIGRQWTPVRLVVDRAAALVSVPRVAFCMVVEGSGLGGLYAGPTEEAWDAAVQHSARLHVIRKARAFQTIVSCAPAMYEDLWTAGKCMYKLEPVLAEGGELIIYAPHLKEVSVTHGKLLHEIGYHCRDFFLKQWPRYERYPWGLLAHSTHVYGQGTYENGVERPRARVTLATQLPAAECARLNLGHRAVEGVRLEDYAGREEQGVLLVRKAGEQLYVLENSPA